MPLSNFIQDVNRVTFFDDFFSLNTAATTGAWVANGVGTETFTIAGASDGIVLLGTGTNLNDSCEIQSIGAIVKLEASKKYTFETRLSVTTAEAVKTSLGWFIGLNALDTSIYALGVITGTDHVGINKLTGAQTLDLVIRRASGTVDRVAAIATYTDDTFTVVRFEVDVSSVVGTGVVRVWIDDLPVVLSGGSYDYQSTSLPTTVALTPTLAVCGTGAAAAATLSGDYVRLSFPRV